MRSLSKLHRCFAAAILVILYFFFQQRSDGFVDNMPSAWHGTAHRVIVFGDDWSDTGKYRVSLPNLPSVAARDPDRGELWTETLCKELACNAIDNFARSSLVNTENTSIGAMIDSDICAEARTGKNKDNTLIDFKTQVQQYLTYEKGRYRIPQRLRKFDEGIVFTVFFGLWDLLEYSKLEKGVAMRAVDDSITELFCQLDILAMSVTAPIRVIVPAMADTTFLPRFQATKSEAQEHFAETQHEMVFLWTYWNAVLIRTATQWKNGEIIFLNTNLILMDQIREKQLHFKGISDASGVGKQNSLFEHVEQPCLIIKTADNKSNLQAAVVEKCSDPAMHLFWDDLHLGGTAHQLIGREAASLLRGNQTVNIERASEDSTNDYSLDGQDGYFFDLKFPPGY